jgi:hypothetical protein
MCMCVCTILLDNKDTILRDALCRQLQTMREILLYYVYVIGGSMNWSGVKGTKPKHHHIDRIFSVT